MNNECENSTDVIKPIIKRAKSFLEEDMKIPILEHKVEIINSEHLLLKKNTAMIGTGGNIKIIITIGYDDEVLEKLVEAFSYGEVFKDEELEAIRESVSCEVANIVVGNAITNPLNESILSITPPVLIYEAKSLAKYKNSIIVTATIKTEFGEVQVSAIGPKELFVNILEFKEL